MQLVGDEHPRPLLHQSTYAPLKHLPPDVRVDGRQWIVEKDNVALQREFPASYWCMSHKIGQEHNKQMLLSRQANMYVYRTLL